MCDFFWAKNGATNGEGDLSDIIRSAQLTNQSQPATWQLQAGPSILAELSKSSSSSRGVSDPFETLREVLFEEVQDEELFEEIKRPKVSLEYQSRVSLDNSSRVSFDEFRVSSMVSIGDNRATVGGVVVGPVGPSELPGSGSGIKRRKGEAKKVVCIPAPVAIGATSSNGRLTTGSEVVPSDLWAWRKYGQKPIKGSPYPRGYYRCSSSKGCPARKQVERSRTDPNMLVISYTSEHNHPWPTHRNALAGSTRGPLSKSLSLNPKITNFDHQMFQDIPSQVGATTIKDEPNNMSVDTRAELSNENLLKQDTEPDPVSVMFSNGKQGGDGVEKFMDPFSLFNWFGENNNNNNTSE